MTPEADAARVLAYTTSLSTVTADPRVLTVGGLLLGGLAWLLRPHPIAVRPSALPPPGGGATDAGTGGRTDRAERVGGRGEPAPKGWLVPGLVPYGPVPRRCPRVGVPPWRWERRGYVTTVIGAGGVGKSYVLLDLALAALAGGEWLGRRCRGVRAALYVDTELDAEECRRRAFPLARGRGRAHPPGGLRYLHLGASLASEEGQTVVAEAVRRAGAGLVLIDSLTIGAFDVAASDQNGWNRVYTFLETLGVPVVAIDHLDKAGRGAFGSFMKQAKVRSCLRLSRVGDGIRVEHTKSNFGPRVPTFTVLASFGDGPGAATSFSVPAQDAPTSTERPVPAVVEQPQPLPLPVREPAPAGQGRALRVLSPLLTGGEWIAPAALVRALEGAEPRVCGRTAGYRLLAHLAAEGELERQGEPGLPARAYRLPPQSSSEA